MLILFQQIEKELKNQQKIMPLYTIPKRAKKTFGCLLAMLSSLSCVVL